MKIYDLQQQIKEKDQRIAELEKENKKFKEENAKLQERLKNAIVPKYKIGQTIWFIHPEIGVDDGEVLLIRIVEDNHIIYRIISGILGNDEVQNMEETEIFGCKAEAQKYLEERNGRNRK